MKCPDCENEMGEPVDTTFSNINTDRVNVGEQTGEIYQCKNCELNWIDDFLNNEIKVW